MCEAPFIYTQQKQRNFSLNHHVRYSSLSTGKITHFLLKTFQIDCPNLPEIFRNNLDAWLRTLILQKLFNNYIQIIQIKDKSTEFYIKNEVYFNLQINFWIYMIFPYYWTYLNTEPSQVRLNYSEAGLSLFTKANAWLLYHTSGFVLIFVLFLFMVTLSSSLQPVVWKLQECLHCF